MCAVCPSNRHVWAARECVTGVADSHHGRVAHRAARPDRGSIFVLFLYLTTYRPQKLRICGQKGATRASVIPRSARAGYPCGVRVGYPGPRSDYPGKSTALGRRLWINPPWWASDLPRCERCTPVREWDTPVGRPRRVPCRRGTRLAERSARESRTPVVRVIYPGQVVRRRYSWGSFWGNVRTSSMITKFASEYMWGR